MNRKDLFKMYKVNTGTVVVDKWGKDPVHIKELTAAAMDEMTAAGNDMEMMVVAIINGVTDEDGKPFFKKEDKKTLMTMSARDLAKVSSAIMELSDDEVDPGK